jgi:hypothetical protein
MSSSRSELVHNALVTQECCLADLLGLCTDCCVFSIYRQDVKKDFHDTVASLIEKFLEVMALCLWDTTAKNDRRSRKKIEAIEETAAMVITYFPSLFVFTFDV